MNKIYYLPERTEIKNPHREFTQCLNDKEAEYANGYDFGFESGVDAVYSAAKEITPEQLAKAIDKEFEDTYNSINSSREFVIAHAIRDFIAEKEAKDANL